MIHYLSNFGRDEIIDLFEHNKHNNKYVNTCSDVYFDEHGVCHPADTILTRDYDYHG